MNSRTHIGDLSYTWDSKKNKTSESITGVMSGYGVTAAGTTAGNEDLCFSSSLPPPDSILLIDIDANGTADVNFQYDALGRRVSRSGTGGSVVYVQMEQQTIADYPVGGAATTPTFRYVYASYIDEPVVRKTAGVRQSWAIADLGERNLLDCISKLGPDFTLYPQLSFEIFTGSHRNLIHFLPTGFDIELFRLSNDPHHRVRFGRRAKIALPQLDRVAYIQTAEDLIIQKLRWARRKDLDDIVNVLTVSANGLDWKYINESANERIPNSQISSH